MLWRYDLIPKPRHHTVSGITTPDTHRFTTLQMAMAFNKQWCTPPRYVCIAVEIAEIQNNAASRHLPPPKSRKSAGVKLSDIYTPSRSNHSFQLWQVNWDECPDLSNPDTSGSIHPTLLPKTPTLLAPSSPFPPEVYNSPPHSSVVYLCATVMFFLLFQRTTTGRRSHHTRPRHVRG